MKNFILMSGTGSYLPIKRISNEDISKMVDTSDEWIQKRSGIKFRHFVDKGELTSDMATKAAMKVIKNSNINSFYKIVIYVVSLKENIKFIGNIN